jgi:hypothetical protein
MSNKYIPFKERNEFSTRKQQSENQLLQYPGIAYLIPRSGPSCHRNAQEEYN